MSDEQNTTTQTERGAPQGAHRRGRVRQDGQDRAWSASTARSATACTSKTVRRSSKLAAHDETNDAHVGDTVRVMETRPVSKSKRWRVVEIVERAK